MTCLPKRSVSFAAYGLTFYCHCIATHLQCTIIFLTIPNSQLDSEWTKASNHDILALDHPSLPYFIEGNPQSAQKTLHHPESFNIKSATICHRW